jgi:glycerol-3-phosphate O-acyltransferase
MGLKNLRFAAGDNLTRLPWIGPRFTSFGAFTVERDTGFDRNYVRKLCSNVVSMIEKGDKVIVFPEGGRSYSGAMLDIRIGILGASVLSQYNNPDSNVSYIPMAVSYEAPPDVPWFSMQLKGKNWRKRTSSILKRHIGNMLYFGADLCAFLPFLTARYYGRTYGNIYIDYGEPMRIKSLFDVAANRNEKARDDFSAHRLSMQKLSDIVYRQLYTLYRILPMHVVASHLIKHGSGSLTDFADVFPEVISSLKKKGRNIKELEQNTAFENARKGIDQLRRIHAVHFRKNICSMRNESLINYYAATIE